MRNTSFYITVTSHEESVRLRLEMKPNDFIIDLRQRIRDFEGKGKDFQFFFAGSILSEIDQTLSNYGIKKESIILAKFTGV